jgi:hypothetical protein
MLSARGSQNGVREAALQLPSMKILIWMALKAPVSGPNGSASISLSGTAESNAQKELECARLRGRPI